MIGIIGSLAGLIKIRNSKTLVDDSTFRLHYRWTTALFFIACGLVAASDLVGSPIQCLQDGNEAPKPITTYCWVSSTFTINTTVASGERGFYHARGSNFEGVGKEDESHERRVHAYYQWVPIILFLMGCQFYLPHIIWKEVEGKRVENLLQGLNFVSVDEANPAKRANIVKYLIESRGRLNGRYASAYFFVQFINLTNVLGMMLLLEWFSGGVFMNYGDMVVRYMNGASDIEHDPLIWAFPRVAKCTFHKFGGSGTITKEDIMCLLPQNILNEKLFLVIWFWMVILMTVTAVRIVYLAALFISPFLRQKRMEHKGKMVSSTEMEALIHRTELGDFFLLMNIAKNVDALCFKEILEALIKNMGSAASQPPHSSNGGPAGASLFNPNAPSYRHFNMDEEDPVDFKRRMEAADTSV